MYKLKIPQLVIGIEPDSRYFERAQSVAEKLRRIVKSLATRVDIDVMGIDPVLDEKRLPRRIETVILPRTLHELLLLHKDDKTYLKKLARIVSQRQHSGDKVLVADPNYSVDIKTRTHRHLITQAIRLIADAYGHFHPLSELPTPSDLIPVFKSAGYRLVETAWKKNESTALSQVVGAHFTVFEKE